MITNTIRRFAGSVPATATAALAIALLGGCGASGPELVPVSGQIRLKGVEEPMSGISVVFVPKPGSGGLAATGIADSDGTVWLQTNNRDGVKPGEYFVGIIDQTVTLRPMFEQPQPGDVLVPRFLPKYNIAQDSGLELSVSQDNGTFSFEVDPNPKRTKPETSG